MQVVGPQSLRARFVQNSRAVDRDALPSICVLKWGGLGSVLTTRPFLQALRNRFGQSCKIIYITSASNALLVERINLADEIFTLEPGRFPALQTLRLALQLRRARPVIFFDLQIHTHRRLAAAIARLSNARRSFGFFRPRENIPRHQRGVFANPFAPVDKLYLELANLAGASRQRSDPRRGLVTSGDDEVKASALLHGWLSVRERLLIVNPNASATAYVRRWPLSYYAEAITVLLGKMPQLRVALIGAAAEKEYVGKLHDMLSPKGESVRNFSGLTSLGSLMALIARADCVLSNDSGPLHLALALDVPTVGLFGPVHPDHNARLGRPERKIILYHPVLCSPCVHHVTIPPCGGNNHCMQMIAPEEVVAACRVFLAKTPSASRHAVLEWQFTRDAHDTIVSHDANLDYIGSIYMDAARDSVHEMREPHRM